MTLSRRVAAIESSLSPTQLVLRWLSEAHSFADIESYVASLLAKDPPVAPLDRLAREAAHGARTSLRGKRPEVVDAAVRSALRETVFRFELVMRITVTTHELLEREGLFDAALSAHLALLTRDEPRSHRYAERHATLRDLAGFRIAELHAAQDARTLAEKRYLDGHSALFPDVAAAWDEQLASTEAIADLAVRLAVVAGVPAGVSRDPEAFTGRTTELVADLVQPAKSSALEKLGEGERAFGIATGWLRAKVAPAVVPVDETVTEQRDD
jgi:hypothetical protein